MVRPATTPAVCAAAAAVMLVLASVSAPVFKSIPLSTVQSARFGVWGFCVDRKGCSPVQVGYSVNQVDLAAAQFSLPASVRKSLTYALVLHPIAAGAAAVAIVLAGMAHRHPYSQSPRFLMAVFMAMLGALLLATVCAVIDVILFHPFLAWATWVTVSAAIVLALATVFAWFTRHAVLSRMAHQKAIDANPAMNGGFSAIGPVPMPSKSPAGAGEFSNDQLTVQHPNGSGSVPDSRPTTKPTSADSGSGASVAQSHSAGISAVPPTAMSGGTGASTGTATTLAATSAGTIAPYTHPSSNLTVPPRRPVRQARPDEPTGRPGLIPIPAAGPGPPPFMNGPMRNPSSVANSPGLPPDPAATYPPRQNRMNSDRPGPDPGQIGPSAVYRPQPGPFRSYRPAEEPPRDTTPPGYHNSDFPPSSGRPFGPPPAGYPNQGGGGYMNQPGHSHPLPAPPLGYPGPSRMPGPSNSPGPFGPVDTNNAGRHGGPLRPPQSRQSFKTADGTDLGSASGRNLPSSVSASSLPSTNRIARSPTASEASYFTSSASQHGQHPNWRGPAGFSSAGSTFDYSGRPARVDEEVILANNPEFALPGPLRTRPGPGRGKRPGFGGSSLAGPYPPSSGLSQSSPYPSIGPAGGSRHGLSQSGRTSGQGRHAPG